MAFDLVIARIMYTNCFGSLYSHVDGIGDLHALRLLQTALSVQRAVLNPRPLDAWIAAIPLLDVDYSTVPCMTYFSLDTTEARARREEA
jgi:hypothetical protein